MANLLRNFLDTGFPFLILTINVFDIPVAFGISVGNVTSFSVSKMSYVRENDSLTTWTSNKDTPIRRLTKDLLWLYDPNVRPVLNFTEALNLTHYFLLQQVIYLDSKEQKLKAFFFEVWIWKDEYLTWDPDDFGNISKITLMRENLWLPDIVVFNQVGENSNYYMRENIIPATVKSTGEIRLDTPQKYETTCLIEIENFPFDVQTCVIVVGSWSQSAATILMKNLSTNMDSTSYIDNSEWELMSTSCVSKILQYEGSDQQYSEIHYTIVLKRRLAFYNRNLIIPMILISFMAQLVFLLPPESGEKISLAITVFLALSLNMLVISEYIPANSLQTPIASKYCLFSMFLVCLSLWLSVLVLNLQGSESASYLYANKPSRRVMRIIRFIGPWLLVGGGPKQRAHNFHLRYPRNARNNPPSSCINNKYSDYQDISQVFIPKNVNKSFESHTGEHVCNHVIRDDDPIIELNHVHCSRNRVGSRLASSNFTQNCITNCNNVTNNNHTHHRNTVYYNVIDSEHESSSIPGPVTGSNPGPNPGPNSKCEAMPKHSPNHRPALNCASNSTCTCNYQNNHHQQHHLLPESASTFENILDSFVTRLEMIHTSPLDKSEISENTKEMLEQWGYLARVVDRFFAVVYFVVNVICLLPFIPYYAGWDENF